MYRTTLYVYHRAREKISAHLQTRVACLPARATEEWHPLCLARFLFTQKARPPALWSARMRTGSPGRHGK